MYRIWKNHTYYITEHFLYGIYPADHVCDHYDAAFGCTLYVCFRRSKWGIDYTGIFIYNAFNQDLNYGRGSAASVILLLVIAAMTMIQMRFEKMEKE